MTNSLNKNITNDNLQFNNDKKSSLNYIQEFNANEMQSSN